MDRSFLDQIDRDDLNKATDDIPFLTKQDSFTMMRQSCNTDFFESRYDGIFMNDSFAGNDNMNTGLGHQQPGLPAPFPNLQPPSERSFQPTQPLFGQNPVMRRDTSRGTPLDMPYLNKNRTTVDSLASRKLPDL